MKDLIDAHRANIGQAGVKLAEAITLATTNYSADVAASEAALEVAIAKRLDAFNGVQPQQTSNGGFEMDKSTFGGSTYTEGTILKNGETTDEH